MAESHEFGQQAETFAARFLVSKGYTIYHRNWRYFHRELDIVCGFQGMLVIVEVKARHQGSLPYPEDLLSPQKERLLIDAAEAYLQITGLELPVRFDLIVVIFHREGFEIEHIEDAFYPGVE
jgi:putative endonuclease